VGAIFKIYYISQNSFRLQASLNQIQDNARTAIDILSSEIHQAGYIGCAKLTNDFPAISSQYPFTIKNKLAMTSTTITVRHAGFENANLINTMLNASILEVSDNVHFKKNNILIISDCKHAEIFTVKNIIYSSGTQKISPVSPLSYQFEQNAEIAHFEVNHFFVAATNQKDHYGKPVSALYVKKLQGNSIRVVDGIKSIHIEQTMNQHRGSAIRIDLEVVSTPLCKTWYSYVAS
jgi:hypothetical protein